MKGHASIIGLVIGRWPPFPVGPSSRDWQLRRERLMNCDFASKFVLIILSLLELLLVLW